MSCGATGNWFWTWTNRMAIVPAACLIWVFRSEPVLPFVDACIIWLSSLGIAALALAIYLAIDDAVTSLRHLFKDL